MDIQGLSLCSRFSYPPNSLSLCGPQKQTDLLWYSQNQTPDAGTGEILSQFSTLYPYLSFIAYENNIKDPFDTRVVEAYWIGNALLKKISMLKFAHHLSDTLDLKKKSTKKNLSILLDKIPLGAFPYHAFHVLNIYKRTGHLESLHTIQSMDACIINWGKVIKRNKNNIIIHTRPLTKVGDLLTFGNKRERTIIKQGSSDKLFLSVKIGDMVSYHWGYFCHILTSTQIRTIHFYTQKAIELANRKI